MFRIIIYDVFTNTWTSNGCSRGVLQFGLLQYNSVHVQYHGLLVHINIRDGCSFYEISLKWKSTDSQSLAVGDWSLCLLPMKLKKVRHSTQQLALTSRLQLEQLPTLRHMQLHPLPHDISQCMNTSRNGSYLHVSHQQVMVDQGYLGHAVSAQVYFHFRLPSMVFALTIAEERCFLPCYWPLRDFDLLLPVEFRYQFRYEFHAASVSTEHVFSV